MLNRQADFLADDAGVHVYGWPDKFGGQAQDRVVSEGGGQLIFRQFYAITQNPWELNFECIPLRAHGFDPDRLSGRLWCHHDRLGREVKGDAQNVGILDVEEAVLVEVI